MNTLCRIINNNNLSYLKSLIEKKKKSVSLYIFTVKKRLMYVT